MVRGLVVAALLLPVVTEGAAHAEGIVVTVTTLKAKSTGPTDPQLRRIRSKLRRVAGYRAYRMVGAERRGCAWSRRQNFQLPGGRTLHLTPRGVSGERVEMQVQLVQGTQSLVETEVWMARDGVVYLGLERSPRSQDGALIFMLTAGDESEGDDDGYLAGRNYRADPRNR